MVLAGLHARLKDQPLSVRRLYGFGRRMLSPGPVWRDSEFKLCYKSLMETQYWPRERLIALQLVRLRELLDHAYAHVPYYRRLFDRQGIAPNDVATLDDLRKLPITTRQDVQQSNHDFVPRNIDPEKLRSHTTGGTTGTPLVIYQDETADPHDDAYRFRQWSWAGYRFGDRLLIMRDDFVGREDRWGNTVKWDYITATNALVLSTFHLNEESMPEFVALIKDFRPHYIEALPSAIGMVAMHMQRHGSTGIRPRAIFCESETISSWQRELIESQFACKVFSAYGHSERAVDAVECEYHQGYHVSMEFGIVEIVDGSGQPVTEEGQSGIAVCTGLDTFAMPMIRYDTGDVVRYTCRPCGCGRELSLITDIEGRLQEFIVTADDELIPVASLHIRTPSYNNVEQFQFMQERKGELVLKIVPTASYCQEDTLRILDELRTQFHHKIKIEPEFVDSIPRTRRGKHRFLDQRLPVNLGVNLGR